MAERKKNSKETFEHKKERAEAIVKILRKEYPSPKVALTFISPLQLLIATILSAQCTDVRVNMVTPALFQRYTTVEEFAAASPSELEELIHSTGFYKNKARNIINCCKELVTNYHGEVPMTMEELFSLPGVGRKTANCVLGGAFGIASGIVVDTHVKRLSNRLGLTTEENPEKIEIDLIELVPKKYWIQFSNALIHHGRKICNARTPKCYECTLHALCPFSKV